MFGVERLSSIMKPEADTPKKKRSVKRTVIIVIVVILFAGGFFLYSNFNRLLSRALIKNFESSIISDVYELKFENLWVNVFEGSIRVNNVTLIPREKPLKNYSYINSYFLLKTKKLTLKNVEIFNLLRLNELHLEKILITKPDIEVVLTGKRHIMMPFKDSTALSSKTKEKKGKSLKSFTLKEFQLINASFHSSNADKQREFNIQNLNISLSDLLLGQDPGQYEMSFSKVMLAIEAFEGRSKNGAIRKASFNNFSIGIDSLTMDVAIDTLMYHFHNFNTNLKALDIQTADSTFHISMQSFDLSYLEKYIKLKSVSFKPNVSHAELQKDYKYQHAEFSGSAGTLLLKQINFDSLIYANKVFIDEVVLDSVMLSIFKDKTKPIDSAKRPLYLSQAVMAVPLPLQIKHVIATRVHLYNTERKPDSTYAKVEITRANLDATNITNLSNGAGLAIRADAYVNDKARFKAGLTYHYNKPQVDFEVAVEKFRLTDLNPLIQAYTPAKINEGTLDEISFSGTAGETEASGTMKFLYHDLEIDLELREQAKWKSAVIAFAANSVLNSRNPISATSPPRIVQFHIKRDMMKGFINVILKSLFNGLKETMIMSKENRKAYHESKKKMAQKNKSK
jgi:hypothetical protein